MDSSAAVFQYLSYWEVLLCTTCGYCLLPSATAWKRHLRGPPHDIQGKQLVDLVTLFSSYQLKQPGQVCSSDVLTVPIEGLRKHQGYYCSLCQACCTRSLKTVQDHLSSQHGKRPSTYKAAPLWKKCILQTFFAENQHVQYSVVQEEDTQNSTIKDGPLAQHTAFFHQQKQDMLDAKQDALAQANQVDGFDKHASTVVPWLSTTGIADHIKGLRKDQIRTAIALPPSDEQSPLQIIINETDKLLREAHSWCFDGPECMLTWPCRVVLGRFQSSQIELMGKTRAFAPRKDATTLKTYFHTSKRFLAYLDRVGASRHDHFNIEPGSGGTAPEEVIELTKEQLSSWT